MQSIQIPDTKPWDGAVALPDLGIIVAQGLDAATFLHGQFSQDMANQPADQSRLAAYCSPKGRMLASFQSLRIAPETYCLLTDRSVLPATLKRLTMFVLRSKVKLLDGAESLCTVGLVGATAQLEAGQRQPGAVWAHEATAGWLTRLPDVTGTVRCLWIGPVDQAAFWLTAHPALPPDLWKWLQVMSAVPQIQAAVVDQFVPQMVNYELVGGVNFSKGCYPGQEIVARSQYRGTLKRRAFIVHSASVLVPGQEVFSEADPGQPAGMVVNAAAIPGSTGWSALVELKLNALDSGLHAGGTDGALLTLGQLPYVMPTLDQGE